MSKPSIVAPTACPVCGGAIEPVAKDGRLQWTNAHGYIPVPDDLVIPTCVECDAEWLDANVARALDDAARAWVPPAGWTKIRKHDPGCKSCKCGCGCTPADAPDLACSCWLEGGPEELWPPLPAALAEQALLLAQAQRAVGG